jgi:hypothetical protein
MSIKFHHYPTVQEFSYFIRTPLRLVTSFKKKLLNTHQQLVQNRSRLLILLIYDVGLLNEASDSDNITKKASMGSKKITLVCLKSKSRLSVRF